MYFIICGPYLLCSQARILDIPLVFKVQSLDSHLKRSKQGNSRLGALCLQMLSGREARTHSERSRPYRLGRKTFISGVCSKDVSAYCLGYYCI